jgi:hypothetical protein
MYTDMQASDLDFLLLILAGSRKEFRFAAQSKRRKEIKKTALLQHFRRVKRQHFLSVAVTYEALFSKTDPTFGRKEIGHSQCNGSAYTR